MSDENAPAHLPLLDAQEGSGSGLHEVKPSWRGWIHAGTFPVSIALGIILVALAQGAEATLACLIFAVTSALLFGISALYHRINWKPATKQLFRRLDHCNIFLLIAGTYTPIAALALPPEKGTPILWIVWGATALGIGFRMFWLSAPRWIYVALYLLLGWGIVMFIGDLFAANAPAMLLVLIGGLLYTLGAIAYASKRPNPFPGAFGFHEIFHTCTVLAYLCHWAAVLLIAT
ncbi:hemolysin III family protein [Galactobacter valiniphilus]|uniref:Hemolysin III family protein n=1 Tax=Galactobacter valiniphilus TaxID=2676122 RepID=A0A399J5W9_9MICC|nr:hemolysin III family protein [Galactobacter valiniphilus]RII40863.1 hemolysin III family protein [Galactobacter valiniphilus]